jgi:hypothetical protein
MAGAGQLSAWLPTTMEWRCGYAGPLRTRGSSWLGRRGPLFLWTHARVAPWWPYQRRWCSDGTAETESGAEASLEPAHPLVLVAQLETVRGFPPTCTHD